MTCPAPPSSSCFEALLFRRRVLRVGDFQEVFSLHLFAGITQQAREGGVHRGKPPIQVRHGNTEIDLFKNRAEALLRNPQLFVEFAAFERQCGLRSNLVNQLPGDRPDAVRLVGRDIENAQHARVGLEGTA